jgi:hypothetical protein
VMQNESLDGLTYSYTCFDILWTLDDGQTGLHLLDMVVMAHRWARIPYSGHCTLEIVMH